MFERLDLLPPDPILGLGQAYVRDSRPDKVGLSVGVYQDEAGRTPVMEAVLEAERRLLDAQETKSYIGQAGDPAFLAGMLELLFGPGSPVIGAERVAIVQTPGGCGALRIGAEVVKAAAPGARVWLSDPTWGNHVPLLTSAGLEIATYPYYDVARSRLDFEAMLARLGDAAPGDVVLLHGCCHNPTGADLTAEQWDAVCDLASTRGLIPFVDLAYQGFGRSLDEDAHAVRLLTSQLPEVVIASSCSKNFGLYRERTGCLVTVSDGAGTRDAALSHALAQARRSYTMAPFHGAAVVGTILADSSLRDRWQAELEQMRQRIVAMRVGIAERLNAAQSRRDFGFVRAQSGMFSYLGIETEQVARLREEFGIYLLESTRINVAGLRPDNLDYVAEAIAETLA